MQWSLRQGSVAEGLDLDHTVNANAMQMQQGVAAHPELHMLADPRGSCSSTAESGACIDGMHTCSFTLSASDP